MNKLILIAASFLLFSCTFEEPEPEVIISEIDGADYLADMDGEMNARKAAHLILDGKGMEINFSIKRAISDSLHCNDSVWRGKYFEALNTILPELDSIEKGYLGANAFSYFLHFPTELLFNLNNKAFNNSEIWLEILSKEYNLRVAPDDITINSVINLAHQYCIDCPDEDKELIIEFVEVLSDYE